MIHCVEQLEQRQALEKNVVANWSYGVLSGTAYLLNVHNDGDFICVQTETLNAECIILEIIKLIFPILSYSNPISEF